jgi:AAA15 family ATPase/GTPase
MHNIKHIRFKGYKVFAKDNYVEMKNISHINIIIGKNNCGKTSLLDIIETIFN